MKLRFARRIAALWAGCFRSQPQRYCWITGLKPDLAARYRDLHAHPWPAVNRRLK